MSKPSGLLQPLVLATVLAVGFAVPWAILVLWGDETVEAYGFDRVQDRLLFRADGTPVIERLRFRKDGRQLGSADNEYRDLEGRPVTVTPEDRWLNHVVLPRGEGEGLLASFLAPDVPWDWRWRLFADRRDPTITWYFLCDGRRHGSAYLVAYDTDNAARVGYLGTAGFRAGPLPPEERFPFDGSERGAYFRLHSLQDRRSQFLPSDAVPEPSRAASPWQVYVQGEDDKMYKVNLEARTVDVALEGRPIRSSGVFTRPGPGRQAGTALLAVRTDDAVLLLDGGNDVVRRFPIPEDLREATFEWLETPAGDVVLWWYATDRDRPGEWRVEVAWFDADGRRARREEGFLRFRPPTDMRLTLGLMVPAPVAVDWFVVVWAPLEALARRPVGPGAYPWLLQESVAGYWPSLLLAHALAAGLAGLCYRRQVRYGAGRAQRLAWPAFVFLFGLPGWVAYRFGRSWPPLERCPACGAPAPRDREGCARCGADFPLPAPAGTEVFA